MKSVDAKYPSLVMISHYNKLNHFVFILDISDMIVVFRRAMDPFGVSVHIISPGFHGTNIVNKDIIIQSFTKAFERASPEIQEQYGRPYIEDSK